MTDGAARHGSTFTAVPLVEAAWRAVPGLLFGLRLAGAVCLALFIAFYLQLDNPGWAGTSAAIVCQPILGASMRKGVFRLVGTLIGAVATVALTAAFPQDRIGFFFGVALWCALCSVVSTLLRNFAAYAAMLAGYTMAIIAGSSILSPDDAFILAVQRGSEIGIGILCGMAVMGLTDVGSSARRLSALIAGIADDIAAGLREDLTHLDAPPLPVQLRRRRLTQRVVALDPIRDQTIGESGAISLREGTLRNGLHGLLLALSAWRTIGVHLGHLPREDAAALAQTLVAALPADTATPIPSGENHADRLIARRDEIEAAARRARTAQVTTASTRLGLDRIASVLDGLGRALNALLLVADTGRARPATALPVTLVADILPALVNGLRVFVALTVAILLYVLTSWSSGLTFMTFVAVSVVLLSPQDEKAAKAATGFGAGTVLAAVVAAIVKFALLPNHEGFLALAAIIAMVLVPIAALSTRPSLAPFLVPATANFIPLLGPTNAISYDTLTYYNSALAIVGGCVMGAAIMRLIPPVPATIRAARLLALTRADLWRIARHPHRLRPDRWRSRVAKRIVALPADADIADGSRLLSALTIGLQLMTLRAGVAAGHCARTPVETIALAVIDGDAARARRTADSMAADMMAQDMMAQDMMAQDKTAEDKTAEDKTGHDTQGPGADVPGAERLRLLGAAREIAETLGHHPRYFLADRAPQALAGA